MVPCLLRSLALRLQLSELVSFLAAQSLFGVSVLVIIAASIVSGLLTMSRPQHMHSLNPQQCQEEEDCAMLLLTKSKPKLGGDARCCCAIYSRSPRQWEEDHLCACLLVV